MKTSLVMMFSIMLMSFAIAEEVDFQFRSDDRPAFNRSISVAELKQLRDSEELVVLDVRLAEDFAESPALIPGSTYQNPESLPDWVGQLDKSKQVVVYCVAGKWVSQKVAFLLDESGIKVRSLEGGLQAWNAAQE